MADTKISALTVATTPLAGTEVLPIVQSGVTKQVSVANLTAGRAVSASSLTLTGTPLAVGSGGTGLTSLTAGYIPYGNGSSAFSSSANLKFSTDTLLISDGSTALAKIQASGGVTLVKSRNSADSGYVSSIFDAVQTIFRTSGTQTAAFNTSGNLNFETGYGVQFLSGTSTVLYDYEEGTWTPAYKTTGGTFTYTWQFGTYRKIGKIVYCTIAMYTSAATVGTGNVSITGLPYATHSNAIYRGGIGFAGYADSFVTNAPTAIYWTENQTAINLGRINGAGWSDLTAANLSTGSPGNVLYVSFTYPTAS